MVRRTSLLLFELLAGLLAGLIILFGAGAWFLSSGPVSLTFLTPLVERALDSADDSYTIRVEDTVLTWAGWQRAVDIRANNVTIEGQDGSIEATLPELSLGLSLRALARGSVTPTSLAIFAPRVSVTRSYEGKVAFGLVADSSEDGASLNMIIERLIAQLLGPPDIEHPLSQLRRISVLGADLTFDDQILGVSWRAPQANIALQRSAIGLGVDVDLTLEINGQRSRVTGDLSYQQLGNTVSLAIRFRDLNPALIAGGAPRLALLSAADLPMSGSLGLQMRADGRVDSFAFDLDSSRGRLAGEVTLTSDGVGLIGTTRFQEFEIAAFAGQVAHLAPLQPIRAPLSGRAEFEATTDGRISRLQFNVDAGAGELDLQAFYPKPVAFVGAQLRGSMIDDMAQLRIADATIDLGGPIATLQASATRLRDDVHVQLEGTLSGLPVRAIEGYWPEDIAPLPREWVTANIIGGTVSKARLSMTARLIGGAIEKADVQSIGGTLLIEPSLQQVRDQPLALVVSFFEGGDFVVESGCQHRGAGQGGENERDRQQSEAFDSFRQQSILPPDT